MPSCHKPIEPEDSQLVREVRTDLIERYEAAVAYSQSLAHIKCLQPVRRVKNIAEFTEEHVCERLSVAIPEYEQHQLLINVVKSITETCIDATLSDAVSMSSASICTLRAPRSNSATISPSCFAEEGQLRD